MSSGAGPVVWRGPAAERAFLVTLFAFGFVLRWLFADGDFNGDESWYFYLAQSFGTEPGVQHERPWFHIAHRPLYYLLQHPSTYGGLLGFRVMGCAVGACAPVLAFCAARRFGASFLSAAIAASFLCLQAQHIRSSAAAFPDMQAATFALAACWAVAARKGTLALLASLCSVASKESFVLVPALIVLLDLIAQRERHEPLRLARWHWFALVVPVLYVGGLTAITLSLPGLRLQGWSTSAFTLRHARNMWLGPELWLVLAWVVWRRDARILVLWLGLPAFYLAWSQLLGRGIANWYVLGPAALSSVAAALTLDRVRADAARVARAAWLVPASVAVCSCCFAPIPLYGLVRARQQWASLEGRMPQPRAAPEVRALIARENPSDLLLVDCFWAFRYSHLRGAQPATAVWWAGPNDTGAVLRAAAAASMVVACREPGHEALDASLRQAHFELLHEDARYLVLARLHSP